MSFPVTNTPFQIINYTPETSDQTIVRSALRKQDLLWLIISWDPIQVGNKVMMERGSSYNVSQEAKNKDFRNVLRKEKNGLTI